MNATKKVRAKALTVGMVIDGSEVAAVDIKSKRIDIDGIIRFETQVLVEFTDDSSAAYGLGDWVAINR